MNSTNLHFYYSASYGSLGIFYRVFRNQGKDKFHVKVSSKVKDKLELAYEFNWIESINIQSIL